MSFPSFGVKAEEKCFEALVKLRCHVEALEEYRRELHGRLGVYDQDRDCQAARDLLAEIALIESDYRAALVIHAFLARTVDCTSNYEAEACSIVEYRPI